MLVALSAVVAAGCALLLVGPTALGGPTSILAVSGNSMEPRIDAGDLILVRSGGPYRVGQIVAYHNIPAAATFLHRIVGIRGTGFAMKGDHNGWIDPGTAQPRRVVGSLWIRIPGGGSAFEWVANPLHGALLAAAAASLIGLRETRRRRKRPRAAAAGRDDTGAPAFAPPPADLPRHAAPGRRARRPPPGGRGLPVDAILRATLAAALTCAAACVVLGVVCFTRPASAAARPAPLFRQSGTLSYQATAAPSPVYPTGRVTSPTPVYLHLVKDATFTFRYRVMPTGKIALSGTGQMRVILHGNTGWTRVLALTPPVRLHGGSLTLQQRISVASIRSLLSSVESLTATPDSYTLAVAPVVVTQGSAGGQPFVRRFTPQFTFALTDAEMTLTGSPASPAAVTSALASTGLETTAPIGSQAIELAVGPMRMPVSWWRVLALVLGTSMLGTAVVVAITTHLRLARKGEPALISARHRDILVPLALAPVAGDRHVNLGSFDDLLRVARRHETTIMHYTAADGDEHYLVLADGVTFRYRSSSNPAVSEQRPEVGTTDTDVA